MLLTITNHRPPATDLGYLLHKHPEKAQSFALRRGVEDYTRGAPTRIKVLCRE